MKKVFQTIVDKGNGNCMQAVVASLFDLDLNDVPHFLEYGDKWYEIFDKFLNDRGFEFTYINRRPNDDLDFMRKIAHFDGGVDDYFFGVVSSQTYKDVTHAVVIDSDLNIVHDPNPNQKALSLSAESILGFYTVSNLVITEDRRILTYEEYSKQ